jgi:hypothetical protein
VESKLNLILRRKSDAVFELRRSVRVTKLLGEVAALAATSRTLPREDRIRRVVQSAAQCGGTYGRLAEVIGAAYGLSGEELSVVDSTQSTFESDNRAIRAVLTPFGLSRPGIRLVNEILEQLTEETCQLEPAGTNNDQGTLALFAPTGDEEAAFRNWLALINANLMYPKLPQGPAFQFDSQNVRLIDSETVEAIHVMYRAASGTPATNTDIHVLTECGIPERLARRALSEIDDRLSPRLRSLNLSHTPNLSKGGAPHIPKPLSLVHGYTVLSGFVRLTSHPDELRP